MSVAIGVHLTMALLALALGSVVLLRPKGTPIHKLCGRVWVALILVVAIGSFGIREISGDDSLSWIHILSAWTIFAVASGFIAIRRGHVARHKGFMIGSFCGLVGAGIFAMVPGRMVGDFLAGLF